jgi:tetrahydromethanopterin S-methyltransferase subunit G
MRSTWTDSRLDDFKEQVDSRFDELSQRIGELSGRIDALQHTTINAFVGMMVAMMTGFVGLAGLIVTQI